MHIALIGYGEVGRILAEDLRARGHEVTAFDLKQRTAEVVPIRAHALVHNVTLAESHRDAVRRRELTISAVTASQTVVAAQSVRAAYTRAASSSISIRRHRARRWRRRSKSRAPAADMSKGPS